MDRTRNLLEQIQGRLDELNKAERKVGEGADDSSPEDSGTAQPNEAAGDTPATP